MHLSSYILDFPLSDQTLILNGLNGHVDIIGAPLWNKLKRGQYEEIDTKILTNLKERQYLFVDKKEESVLLGKIAGRLENSIIDNKEFAVSINFSEACNLSCFYCVNRFRRNQSRMTTEHIDNVFKTIKKLEKGGKTPRKEIILFGGEPLMLENRILLEYLVSKLQGSLHEISIITNGVTIQSYMSLFKENKELFAGFQITIDGPQGVHDKRRISRKYPRTFKTITQGIDDLLEAGFQVILRTNADHNNFNTLPELASFIKKKGWHKLKHFKSDVHLIHGNSKDLCLCDSSGNSNKFIQNFRDLREKHPDMDVFDEKTLYNFPQIFLSNVFSGVRNCPKIAYCMSCGGSSFTFDATGKVYACMASVGIPEFQLGEYYPVYKWNEKQYKTWQNRLSHKLEKCRKCPLTFICGGLCPLQAYETNGKISQPNCSRLIGDLRKFVSMDEDRFSKGLKEKS